VTDVALMLFMQILITLNYWCNFDNSNRGRHWRAATERSACRPGSWRSIYADTSTARSQ